MKKLIEKINFSKKITCHLLGEEHTKWHRRCTGIIIMIFGVCVAKGSVILGTTLHIAGDVIGYSLHGVGLIPWVEKMEKKSVLGEQPTIEKHENNIN